MPVVTPNILDRIPTLTLPDGRVCSLLNEQLYAVNFLPPQLQDRAIQQLGEYLEEAHALPEGTTMDNGAVTKHSLIDVVSWQLAKFMRYSSPTRITEAIPALTYITESYKSNHNGQVSEVPTLYLGVALSRIEGEEERAIRTFNEGFDSGGSALNLIWARANFARMLRRMNRIAEAEEQERETRQWILFHPYAFPPSRITSTISDDLGTGINILDHPDILSHFGTSLELDSSTMITFG